ncbi:MAG: zinc metallopeptidase [Spirochaetaceae bacterium]|nr:MAG: zinc metallopeptidase [Spirochaetaceae bacterium]
MYGLLFQYWWILLPAILLGTIAQLSVRGTYQKYRQVKTRDRITGAEVARRILDEYDLQDVPIETVRGELTDHYDPRSKILRLSQGVYQGDNIAALGIAAHETGHAIQHARSYFPLAMRGAIYPVASFGSKLGPVIVLGGLLFGFSELLISIGIVMFAIAVVFSIITLPVELNASTNAISVLRRGGFLSESELSGARSVLNAAALTYVAAALASVLTLVRLLLLSRRR